MDRGDGRHGTSGFGGLLKAEVGEATARALGSDTSLGGPVWDLRLRFREPVIFSKRRIADNLFESGEAIPGGALKGAVAEMAAREGGHFASFWTSCMRCASPMRFPTKAKGARPRQRPLSLLTVV